MDACMHARTLSLEEFSVTNPSLLYSGGVFFFECFFFKKSDHVASGDFFLLGTRTYAYL